MQSNDAAMTADRGQRRASLSQTRSKETKRMLVQAAMALWRTNGYANTTVADICRAAGVSKALFYFYFPRKEDVLFEVGIMSTRSAQRAIANQLAGPDYDIADVITAALHSMEKSMTRNPRELVIETILEGYRHEHRILAAGRAGTSDTDGRAGKSDTAGRAGKSDTAGRAGKSDTDGAPADLDGGMFTELFTRARDDGKLPASVDVNHLTYLAMTFVSEGARHWAAGSFGARSFADVVSADIATLITGIQTNPN
ncbi:TetR/AcrR family transcriptional regulator [Mycobacterium sp. OTB74]|jgi:AcrR family transcriptional regulator|uniref:TetR/AcrR family transcriptional regulator n=1 Tax=Mycobacterium sp. OTB74 TaxID=1853452 RepID=UPI002476EB0D|nr:TetR/AcrR family transcriptional regulator [Mycobacterium sp. OTB74]MDH6245289.1 AcrR family transcriptional regulator [Mycobacterium sp. OTB74]